MSAVAHTAASRADPRPKPPQIQGAHDLIAPAAPTLRFGLRHLFWFVTAISLLLSSVTCFPEGSYGSLVVLSAVALVALHLMSTAVGSHLRAEADKTTGIFQPIEVGAASLKSRLNGLDAPSPLYTRGIVMPRLPLLVIAGVIFGGCLGATLLELTIGGRTTAVGVAVGALSTAVLGGWFAFLFGSFSAILRRGWREAVAQQKLDETRHQRPR